MYNNGLCFIYKSVICTITKLSVLFIDSLTVYNSLCISVSSAGPPESGTVRSESWSYEEQQVDIEEGISQVEFLLSSVLRERSRNLPSSEGPGQPLLSDIERQIRQLEQGQHTLAQVILGLRDLARTKNQEAPLEFQARVEVREVRQRQSRHQRTTVGELCAGQSVFSWESNSSIYCHL